MPPKYRPYYIAPQPIAADNIGHKMLEKMGWRSGHGLGKNNQGMLKSLPVRQKYDTAGLRCKNETSQDLPHQKAFKDLLEKLSSSSNEELIDCNTPLQTKIFRRTSRYRKVTKAKDVSNYAFKDLQGILGSGACNETNVGQGCVSNSMDLCQNIPQPICENIIDNLDEFPFLESHEKDYTISRQKECDQRYSRTNGKKGRKKNYQGSVNEFGLDLQDSDYKPLKIKDNSTLGNNESKKRRNRLAKSKCQNVLFDEEGTSHDFDVHKNGKMHATSSNFIQSLECEDVLANTNKPGNLDNYVDPSFECDVKTSNNIKTDPSRSTKTSFRGEKCKSVDTSSHLSDEDSESDSTITAKPISNHFMGDDDKDWKQKVINNPVLLEELCSRFVGSNLHKIKGYGNW